MTIEPVADELDLDDVGPPAEPDVSLAKIGDLAAAAGIRRVRMYAWRDLEHPEAGGSEIHAARVAERWAAAGIEVRLTASRAEGAARLASVDGYHVERPAGRYAIFPAVAARRIASRAWRAPRSGNLGPSSGQATVEIWNGMPFMSPIWAPGPRLVFLHHVHDRMWDLVLPRGLAAAGRIVEKRIAPPLYRRTPVVTLSESSRQGIIDLLDLHPDRVHVVAPGVDESFRPGPARSPEPLIAAVGRLVPYKRFDRLIEVLVRLRRHHPTMQAVIAGEGSERSGLEELVRLHRAGDWLSLPGRLEDEALLDLYQRAWAVASSSAFEGWGLTITEAAACATTAVASRITGHADAVEHGVTGFLAGSDAEMEAHLHAVLGDPFLRRRMERAAHRRASELTWDRTATETMRILAGG